MSPRWGSTSRLTDWPTVSRNVTLTLTLTFAYLPRLLFLSRNILCGSVLIDDRARKISDACSIWLLNTGADAHPFHLSVNLALCSPGLAVYLGWFNLPALHFGNHCPASLHISTPSTVVRRYENWVIRRDDCEAIDCDIRIFGISNCKLHVGAPHERTDPSLFAFYPQVIHHASSPNCPMVDR
jgi:hypothetical protein